jgi:hypothetical protein
MTSEAVSPRKRHQESGRQLSPEQAAAAAMVAEARARGLELTGPNGLLKLFTKNVLETALNEELNGKRSAIDCARHVRHLKVGRSHDPGEAEFGNTAQPLT